MATINAIETHRLAYRKFTASASDYTYRNEWDAFWHLASAAKTPVELGEIARYVLRSERVAHPHASGLPEQWVQKFLRNIVSVGRANRR